MSKEHTKTPWKYVVRPGRVALVQDKAENPYTVLLIADDKRLIPSQADAAFIVRCVNSHNGLVSALQETLDALRVALEMGGRSASHEHEVIDQARKALEATKE